MESFPENKRQITVAIALIKDGEGRILLQQRLDPLIPDAHEKWEFPGGRIDYGESPEDTVIRECQEEIGCQIKINKLSPKVQSSVWGRADSKEQHVIILCYEAEIINGTPTPMDKKVSEVRWFFEDEIVGLDLLRGIREFINYSNIKYEDA
jgi:8-oxo-dGTP diphosphatase